MVLGREPTWLLEGFGDTEAWTCLAFPLGVPLVAGFSRPPFDAAWSPPESLPTTFRLGLRLGRGLLSVEGRDSLMKNLFTLSLRTKMLGLLIGLLWLWVSVSVRASTLLLGYLLREGV